MDANNNNELLPDVVASIKEPDVVVSVKEPESVVKVVTIPITEDEKAECINVNGPPEMDRISIDSSSSVSWSSLINLGDNPDPQRNNSRRSNKCFPFCPISLVSPSCAARLLLRNMVVPREMWDEFPDGLSYHISDYFLYQPNMPKEARLFLDLPSMYEMPYEEVWMVTKDKVKINGFLVKQDKDIIGKVPTIIFFHGNAGNIGHRLDNAKMLHEQLNCNVLLVEYRGFGRSEGNPSEKGLYADAKAAFKYVESREDLDPTKIVVFGRSLGGAVAIDLASRRGIRDRVAALIVENTFTSIPDLAKALFDITILRCLPHWCYKNRYESLQKIEKVICPTFFISGTQDEILPVKMMDDLYDHAASGIKELTYFHGSHNETYTCEGYTEEIGDYFKMANIDYPKIFNLGPSLVESIQPGVKPVGDVI